MTLKNTRLPTEQELRRSFEDDGMTEAEIERGLDAHEAANPDDEDAPTVGHSDGPWSMVNACGDDHAVDVAIIDAKGMPVVEISVPHGDQQRHANARLIAAAPRLAQSLRRLSAAALARDATMGDQINLIRVRVELAEANREACAILKELAS